MGLRPPSIGLRSYFAERELGDARGRAPAGASLSLPLFHRLLGSGWGMAMVAVRRTAKPPRARSGSTPRRRQDPRPSLAPFVPPMFTRACRRDLLRRILMFVGSGLPSRFSQSILFSVRGRGGRKPAGTFGRWSGRAGQRGSARVAVGPGGIPAPLLRGVAAGDPVGSLRMEVLGNARPAFGKRAGAAGRGRHIIRRRRVSPAAGTAARHFEVRDNRHHPSAGIKGRRPACPPSARFREKSRA